MSPPWSPREGTRPTLADLDAFVRKQIAGCKVPAACGWSDEVKRSPAGKPTTNGPKEQTEQRPPTRCTPNMRGHQLMRRTVNRFGIEYPIFAFTPSEKVAAAVSRAGGGMGVLGCVRFNDPTTSRTSCNGWTRTPTANRTASTW